MSRKIQGCIPNERFFFFFFFQGSGSQTEGTEWSTCEEVLGVVLHRKLKTGPPGWNPHLRFLAVSQKWGLRYCLCCSRSP